MIVAVTTTAAAASIGEVAEDVDVVEVTARGARTNVAGAAVIDAAATSAADAGVVDAAAVVGSAVLVSV